MIDRYIDRPNLTRSSRKFAVLDVFCFAEFSPYYYLPSNPKYKESDYQPEELDDEIVEDISNSDYLYPKDIKLLLNEKKRHMFYSIIKKPNLYYPFRDKKELLSGNPPTYTSDNAFLRLSSDTDNILDLYDQQENDEINDYLTEDIDDSESKALETMEAHSTYVGNNNLMSNKLSAIPDNIIYENIRSLNMEQREISNFIHKFSRDYIKNLRCKVIKKVKSFHIFFTWRCWCWKISFDKNNFFVFE